MDITIVEQLKQTPILSDATRIIEGLPPLAMDDVAQADMVSVVSECDDESLLVLDKCISDAIANIQSVIRHVEAVEAILQYRQSFVHTLELIRQTQMVTEGTSIEEQ